jgi:hypothetical protein
MLGRDPFHCSRAGRSSLHLTPIPFAASVEPETVDSTEIHTINPWRTAEPHLLA